MQTISIISAILLGFTAMLCRRPASSVMVLVLSYCFAVPVAVLSTGANSAIFVSDVVLFAVLIRWWSTAMRNVAVSGAPRGLVPLAVVFAAVVFSRVMVIARAPTAMSMNHLAFYSLRFLAFGLVYVVVAGQRFETGDFRKLIGWTGFLAVGFAVANLVSRAGVVDLHFILGDVIGTGVQSLGFERERQTHLALLGFNRASIGLIAYIGIVLLLIRSFLGGATNRLLLFVWLPLLGFLLLDSFSRSAALAMIVAVAILAMRMSFGQSLGLIVAVGLGGAVILFGATDPAVWGDRFAALFSREAFSFSTGQSRLEDWASVLGYLATHPMYVMFGAGFLGYAPHYLGTVGVSSLSAAHNMYLQALCEVGMFGLAACLVLWTRWLRLFWRSGRSAIGSPQTRIVGRGMFAFLLGVLVSGLSQESLFPTPSMYGVAALMMLLIGAAEATLDGYRPTPVGPVASRRTAVDGVYRELAGV